MTILDALKVAREQLAACCPDEREASAQADWLLCAVLGIGRAQLILSRSQPLAADKASAFSALVARRLHGEPIQYLLGTQDFLGHPFSVTPDVLIPRVDSEVLAEHAIRRVSNTARVLDVGTGSGALAVSIALARQGAQVTAIDISEAALDIARGNAHSLGAKVRFVASDLFAALGGENFDVIVSNPPYIPRGELASLAPEVQAEPRLALDGGGDGLTFYRALAEQAGAHLAPGGCLLVEVGQGQADAVSALFAQHIGTPFVVNDLQGIARVVGAVHEKASEE